MPRTQDFDTVEVVGRARDLFWDKGFEATSIPDLERVTVCSYEDDARSAMTSFSSIASCTNFRADTVPTAPAPSTRTFTNSSFHCWRGTRSGCRGTRS